MPGSPLHIRFTGTPKTAYPKLKTRPKPRVPTGSCSSLHCAADAVGSGQDAGYCSLGCFHQEAELHGASSGVWRCLRQLVTRQSASQVFPLFLLLSFCLFLGSAVQSSSCSNQCASLMNAAYNHVILYMLTVLQELLIQACVARNRTSEVTSQQWTDNHSFEHQQTNSKLRAVAPTSKSRHSEMQAGHHQQHRTHNPRCHHIATSASVKSGEAECCCTVLCKIATVERVCNICRV